MDADLIDAAMQMALELSVAMLRGQSEIAGTDAWLRESFDAKPYARPSGVDSEGFFTVGEVRNVRTEQIGFVLLNPDRKAVKLAWSNDSGVWFP
jgi:hypothetical protein